MAVGWTFRDHAAARPAVARANHAAPIHRLAAIGLAAIVVAVIAPVHAAYLDRAPVRVALDRLVAPEPPRGWQLDAAATDSWRPVVVGADRELNAIYRAGARRVHLNVAFYVRERQGAKAVSSVNRVADEGTWQRVTTEPMRVTIEGAPETVPASRVVSGGARRLVWQWYWIGGHVTASPLRAKLLQLEAAFRGGLRSAAVITLAAPYDADPAEAAATLADFVAARPDISGVLRRASATGGG
jgi:EpsI family protein